MTEETKKEIPYKAKLLGAACGGAVAITGIVAALTEPLSVFGLPLSFAGLWFWASAAYIGASFRWTKPVQADQIAVLTLFGNPKDILGPGLPFVPIGLFNLEYLPTTVNQEEFPAQPEKVYHGEIIDTLPEGMKPPIRITFNESIPDSVESAKETFTEKDYTVLDLHKIYGVEWSKYTYEQLDAMERTDTNTLVFNPKAPKDGLARRVTADAVIVAQWRIEDGTKFIQNVTPLETEDNKHLDDTAKRIAEVNKRIEDEMISVLTRLLQKMSYGQAQNNINWINAHLFFAVIKRTLGWGIKIEGAIVKKIDAPKRVNEAIANAAKAEFQGNADKELAIKAGEGAANAARKLVEQTLIGQANGQKKLVESLGISGSEVVAAEVAREIAKGGNAIIFGADGMAQAASVIGAMVKGKTPPNPPA